MPSAILLTSTFLRHHYVINTVAMTLDLLGVWQEEKSFVPEKYAGNADDRKVIQSHFAERDRSEDRFFGDHAALRVPATTVVRKLKPATINDAAEVQLMAGLKPDIVLVYGTGILKDGIIGAFEGRIINIHLGLSPYYRGSGTNFWPLVNREPEYVGATILQLDAGIDTGPVIAHVRPEIASGDGPHDIGNKAIVAACDALCAAAIACIEGRAPAVPQEGKGRLYQRKDFNADAVRLLRKNFETGMISEYLRNKTERDAKIDLVPLS
jgi:methionyl-tRNA formyltransferase